LNGDETASEHAALPTCPWSYADGQCEIRASGIQTNDNSNPAMLINRWMQSNSWWLGRAWSNYRGSCWRDGSSTGPPSNDVVLTFTFSQSTPVNAFRMNAYRSGLHAVNILPRQFKIQYQNAAGTWVDIPCTGSSCSSGQPPHRSGGGWICSGVTNQWAVWSYAHNRQIEFDFSSSQCVVTKTMRIVLTAQRAGTSNAGNGFGFVRQMTFFHKQSGTAPCSQPSQQAGTNCWNQCNRQAGPCAWCGAGGRCCRNSGMLQEEAGCEGFNRGYNRFAHKCSF